MKCHQLVVMPASVEDWLDRELEVRGIDAVVYTRYILSILQQDNDLIEGQGYFNKRNIKETLMNKEKSNLRAEQVKLGNFEEMKKNAAVECLMSVSEQKCGIEKLVDELCDKLKNIQGNGTLNSEQGESTIEVKHGLNSPHSEEREENYYSAFPTELSTEKSTVWKNVKKIIGDEEKENNENEEEEENGKKILVGYIECDWLNTGNAKNEQTPSWLKMQEDGDLDVRTSTGNLGNLSTNTVGNDTNTDGNTNGNNNNNSLNAREETDFDDGQMDVINNEKNKAKQFEIKKSERNSSPLAKSTLDEYRKEDDGVQLTGSNEIRMALGEAEMLAKLAAKFNDEVASIWKNEGLEQETKKDDIWQMAPICNRRIGQREKEESNSISTYVDYGREYVWPNFVGATSLGTENQLEEHAKLDTVWQRGNSSLLPENKQWNCADKCLYSSFDNLEIDCSDRMEKQKCTFDASPPPLTSKDEEMQLIWEILGNALRSDLKRDRTSLDFHVDGYQDCTQSVVNGNEKWQRAKRGSLVVGELGSSESLVDLQTIWNSSQLEREISRLDFPTYDSPTQNEANKERWMPADVRRTSTESLTRSYDSYLNRIYRNEEGGMAMDPEAQSEPTASPKNCTLTYHKGESCFVEVKPSYKRNSWRNEPVGGVVNFAPQNAQYDHQKENLLTSPKTHFRPIRQESFETDATTTSSEESAVIEERKRKSSPSSTLMVCSQGHEEEEEESSDEFTFFPQNCIGKSNKEKFCQTEETDVTKLPIEFDCGSDMPRAVANVLDDLLADEINVNAESELSSSLSPCASCRDGSDRFGVEVSSLSNCDRLVYLWADVDTRMKWSTAPDDDLGGVDDEEEDGDGDQAGNDGDKEGETDDEDEDDDDDDDDDDGCVVASDGMAWHRSLGNQNENRAIGESVKCEKIETCDGDDGNDDGLFEDVNFLHVMQLDEQTDGEYSWMKTLNENSAQKMKLNSSSSDGEATAFNVDNLSYAGYFGDVQSSDKFVGCQLPLVPSNKVLYSTDLEEEWKKNIDSTKNRNKTKTVHVKRPCSFYMEGNCRRTDCKFSHDLASITCRFWVEGSCFKGVTCPFLHGFHNGEKDDDESKCDFKLELESETHFPTLCKPKDLVQSSSSDSTPITIKTKRQRKRYPLKDQSKGSKHKFRSRASKSSSSEDDAIEL